MKQTIFLRSVSYRVARLGPKNPSVTIRCSRGVTYKTKPVFLQRSHSVALKKISLSLYFTTYEIFSSIASARITKVHILKLEHNFLGVPPEAGRSGDGGGASNGVAGQ